MLKRKPLVSNEKVTPTQRLQMLMSSSLTNNLYVMDNIAEAELAEKLICQQLTDHCKMQGKNIYYGYCNVTPDIKKMNSHILSIFSDLKITKQEALQRFLTFHRIQYQDQFKNYIKYLTSKNTKKINEEPKILLPYSDILSLSKYFNPTFYHTDSPIAEINLVSPLEITNSDATQHTEIAPNISIDIFGNYILTATYPIDIGIKERMQVAANVLYSLILHKINQSFMETLARDSGRDGRIGPEMQKSGLIVTLNEKQLKTYLTNQTGFNSCDINMFVVILQDTLQTLIKHFSFIAYIEVAVRSDLFVIEEDMVQLRNMLVQQKDKVLFEIEEYMKESIVEASDAFVANHARSLYGKDYSCFIVYKKDLVTNEREKVSISQSLFEHVISTCESIEDIIQFISEDVTFQLMLDKEKDKNTVLEVDILTRYYKLHNQVNIPKDTLKSRSVIKFNIIEIDTLIPFSDKMHFIIDNCIDKTHRKSVEELRGMSGVINNDINRCNLMTHGMQCDFESHYEEDK